MQSKDSMDNISHSTTPKTATSQSNLNQYDTRSSDRVLTSKYQSEHGLSILTIQKSLYPFIRRTHYYQGQTTEQLKILHPKIAVELQKWALNPRVYRETENNKNPITKLILDAEDALKISRKQKQNLQFSQTHQVASAAIAQPQPLSIVQRAITKEQEEANFSLKDAKILKRNVGTWFDPDTGSEYEGTYITNGIDQFIKLVYRSWKKMNSDPEMDLDPKNYQEELGIRIISVRKWYMGIKKNAERYKSHLMEVLEKEKNSLKIFQDKKNQNATKSIQKKIEELLKESSDVQQSITNASTNLINELKRLLLEAKRTYRRMNNENNRLDVGLVEDESQKFKMEIVRKKIRNLIRDLNRVRKNPDALDWHGVALEHGSYNAQYITWDDYLEQHQAVDHEENDDEDIEIEWFIFLCEQAEKSFLEAKVLAKNLTLSSQHSASAGVESAEKHKQACIEADEGVTRKRNNLARARSKIHKAVLESLINSETSQKNYIEALKKMNLKASDSDFGSYTDRLNIQIRVEVLKQKIEFKKLELKKMLEKYPPIEILAEEKPVSKDNNEKVKTESASIGIDDQTQLVSVLQNREAHSVGTNSNHTVGAQDSQEILQTVKLNHAQSEKIKRENSVLASFRPDQGVYKDQSINWWPQLAALIKRNRRKEEGDFGCECWGFRGFSEEAAVIIRQGPCLLYLIGFGSIFGTLMQLAKLDPDTEEQNFNLNAVLGLAGGMVGFIIGCIRMGYLNPYTKIASSIFTSLAEACGIFIFVTGEIITVYCNDKAHWSPVSDFPLNNATNVTTACMVSDVTFATNFASGPAATALLYLVFNTLWHLIPENTKLKLLTSDSAITRGFTYLAYGTDYILKTLLFSRIFQYAMMSSYFSEATAYEWGALPAALIVTTVQTFKPTTRQRFYTSVLGIMALVMYAQKIKTTIALCERGVNSPTWGTGLAYIVTDIIALGVGGILSAMVIRKGIQDYKIIEESHPLDTLTLISQIEKLVLKELEEYYKNRHLDKDSIQQKLSSNIQEELRIRVRREVGVTYLETFARSKQETDNVEVDLEACLTKIVHMVTDEVIKLIKDEEEAIESMGTPYVALSRETPLQDIAMNKGDTDKKKGLDSTHRVTELNRSDFPPAQAVPQPTPLTPGYHLSLVMHAGSQGASAHVGTGPEQAFEDDQESVNKPAPSSWRNLWGCLR